MSKRYVVKLTLEQAEQLGIVRCAYCGYPRNNHFDFGKRVCADSGTCPGYKRGFRVGKAL